jgi:hypothetical protein
VIGLRLGGLEISQWRRLRQRGVPEPIASLTANVGVLAFTTAFALWVNAPDEFGQSQLIREALDQLKAITSGV